MVKVIKAPDNHVVQVTATARHSNVKCVDATDTTLLHEGVAKFNIVDSTLESTKNKAVGPETAQLHQTATPGELTTKVDLTLESAEKQAVIMETDQLCQTATPEVNNPEVDSALKSGKNGSHPKYVKGITTDCYVCGKCSRGCLNT